MLAVQAASRLGAEQSAKLCVQYLAPIFKNRQYNFPPLGENLFVGASARPNEITYSEDWLRPDYVPPPSPPPDLQLRRPAVPSAHLRPQGPRRGTAQPRRCPPEPTPTNPSAGLQGMMVPTGGGQ